MFLLSVIEQKIKIWKDLNVQKTWETIYYPTSNFLFIEIAVRIILWRFRSKFSADHLLLYFKWGESQSGIGVTPQGLARAHTLQGVKKFHGVLTYKFQCLRSIERYCSRSQPETPPLHAHVCTPMFAFPPAHRRSRKESGKYFTGFTRDDGDLTGKPCRSFRFLLSPADPFFLLLYRVGREVRIISPFAGATMCGTGHAFIYETVVAVKSQIATQICRADNNGVSCRVRKKLLRTLVRIRRRKRVRAVGTSRGLALTTRL